MKKIFSIAPIALFIILTSFEAEAKTETTKTKIVIEGVKSKQYEINTSKSTIVWKGKAVTHSQTGNLSVNSGNFTLENNSVVSGTIEIDMTSLTVSSIPPESENNAKLVEHLKTDDFFNVAKFPTATLTITDGSDMNNIKANITIKGLTEEITFTLSSAKKNGVITLTSSLKIDRTKFDVTYSSGNFFENLGDHLIHDEFELNVTLVST